MESGLWNVMASFEVFEMIHQFLFCFLMAQS